MVKCPRVIGKCQKGGFVESQGSKRMCTRVCASTTDELYTRCPAAMLMWAMRGKCWEAAESAGSAARAQRLNRQLLFQRGSLEWASSAGRVGRPVDACLSGFFGQGGVTCAVHEAERSAQADRGVQGCRGCHSQSGSVVVARCVGRRWGLRDQRVPGFWRVLASAGWNRTAERAKTDPSQ